MKLRESATSEEPLGSITASKGFTTTILWADNHNEVKKRMTTDELAEKVDNSITFTVNGKEYSLNSETMKYLGMNTLPRATVSEDGVNAYTLSYPENSFPIELQDEDGKTYSVEWSFSQPEWDGYDSVEVNAGTIS